MTTSITICRMPTPPSTPPSPLPLPLPPPPPPPQVYWWHDKYKPRKPKYFNRVHTGYEWSKYNQTHYDYDNPPPKVVQGYKFNILYHDLIDRSKVRGVGGGERDRGSGG